MDQGRQVFTVDLLERYAGKGKASTKEVILGTYRGQLHEIAVDEKDKGENYPNADDTFEENKALLDYAKLREGADAVKPSSMAVSEFHFLLLIGNKVKELQFDHTSESVSRDIIGLCSDATAGLFYAYDQNSIFQVSVNDKGRDMWKVYLDMKEYAAALANCREPLQRDHIYLLQVGTELAMAEADTVEYDEDLRKKLWLLVTRHVIEQEKGTKRENIRKAIAFLKETDGLLKFEDILPFFLDFALIDGFKEAICSSLEDYNKQIEQLKQEMNDATHGANNIRNDISAFAQRHAVIDCDEECGVWSS
ncbi:hypothetical protein GH714_043497 [Hevea brasiliensis]|uniref:Pep3/Vps18 beta-propeller domain-containing protein n=1 Tax=Hevea brasiliensis TaxID=3981 RepID=A0A6A6K3E3_HEVBR|nr:hypothetical protein GH714_043497 [Hevea brasiliensis]